MFGLVLTNAKDFDSLRAVVKKQNLDTLKVISGWGLPWNGNKDNNRALVCSLTRNTIVRTVSGDPSTNTIHPIKDLVLAEIEPWYRCKRDIIIEIGNEPNIAERSGMTSYAYEYRWYLRECIEQVRKIYPLAKIMSTALQPDNNASVWYQIFSDPLLNIYNMVDYIAVHAYEHVSFMPEAAPKTNHLDTMLKLFSVYKKKLFFSELGINGLVPDTQKIYEYQTVAKRYPVTYYHHCHDQKIDALYHIM